MKRTTLLGALPLAALSLAVSVPGSAAAAPSTASFSQVIGSVQTDPSDPTRATVQARYRCTGDAHLWVSVKQTADRTADPRLAEEGSSGISAAWSDSHRNEITCDSRIHVGWFGGGPAGAALGFRGAEVDRLRAARQGRRLRPVLPVRRAHR